MKEPSLYEKINLKVINVLSRIFAYSLVFGCILGILQTIASYTGLRSPDEYPIWLLILFIPLLVLGVLATRAKPYYPEKYREWYEQKSKKT